MVESRGGGRGGLLLEEAGEGDFACVSQNVAPRWVGLMDARTEFGPPACLPHLLRVRKIDRQPRSRRARSQTPAPEIQHLSFVTASDSKPPVE